ncbi:translation initiation factor IF-2 [Rudanella lutea]|uniref:translation initiation factor IF-2 n=1 Tax=Rudanella lutea TaxID=451374 RepID=UPI00048348DA|nr:translation initiation factor IF-2 [Rudanella lutea]
MAEDKSMRLSQVAKVLHVGLSTVVSKLSAKGYKVDSNPNTKIPMDQLEVLAKEFKSNDLLNGASKPAPVAPAEAPRKQDDDVILYRRDDAGRRIESDAKRPEAAQPQAQSPADRGSAAPSERKPESGGSTLPGLKVLGKIDLNAKPGTPAPQPRPATPQPPVAPAPVAKAPEPAPAPKPAAPVAAQPPVAPAAPAPVAKAPEPAPAPVAKAPEPTPAPKPAAPAPAPAAPVAQAKPAPAAPAPVAKAPEPTPAPAADRGPADRSPADRGPAEPKQAPAPEAARPATPPAAPANTPPAAPEPPKEPETIRAEGKVQLQGLTVKGTIDLSQFNRQPSGRDRDRGKRKRIRGKEGSVASSTQPNAGGGQGGGQGQGGQGGPRNDRGPRDGNNQNRPNDNRQGQGGPRNDRGPREGQANTAGGQQGQGGQRNDRGPRDGNNNNTQGQQGQGQGGGNRNNNTGGRPNNNNNNNRGGNRGGNTGNNNNRGGTRDRRETPSEADVRANIRATNARLQGNNQNRGADRRRDRRRERSERERERMELENEESKTLRVTEFVSANDLASMMDVSVNEVIATCMSLGMFVSINQRLDAEAITVIADEFGYDVEFVTAEQEVEAGLEEIQDAAEDLQPRAPIVTIMGHVDHGKTSLLDYIRRTKVAAGEAGGITQHIGAYSVKTTDGRMVTFLDTPGHEAFTAMRARGAKVTDVVIIVIAADDSIMPQTREAINHAQVAGVPIVFAFSKVDKPGADAEKIRNALSQMNILVEEWGGKYQSQEISSKSGLGVDDLLEKVLLEAEVLELKANPNRRAIGTVIEAQLDKGRGYVSTVLVETGTLKQGDVMLVGAHYGRIRAMTNDRGERIKEAGPSTPVQILGLPGAPQAGDKFNVMETEREAREIANKREQLLREQSLRTRKHITLEEIGRRKAIGSFKELNVIVKGDVDGSVEALSDSLLQLSTGEVQVNIIHKAVGQISESDILLASASDAIIVGFQVRPSANARRLAEQEQIEIRLYSIIYDAINEVKDAMEGLLAPTQEEVITGNIEVREVFKISKIGTVAGCMVTDGNIKRNNKIRVIRDFIVIHTGDIDALKRFKDDVSEVRQGYECGLSIKNFNDIQVGDIIEGFEFKEVKRTLSST